MQSQKGLHIIYLHIIYQRKISIQLRCIDAWTMCMMWKTVIKQPPSTHDYTMMLQLTSLMQLLMQQTKLAACCKQLN